MSSKNFVVIAEFKVKSGTQQEFLDYAREDARDSVANEPGCQQFEALYNAEDADTVVLYEVYDDKAAFEAHLQAPHYLKFANGIEPLTVEKNVRFFGHLV